MNTPPVRILVHHAPIRVAYQAVPPLVPTLLSPPASTTSLPSPNIVLHIGLAAGRKFYTLEHGAHGRGYGSIPDVDGERFPDSTAESKWPSKSYPNVLETGFRIKDVWRRWRARLDLQDSEFDVRMSEDAGNFMCGFIYWNSLVHYWEKEAKRQHGQKGRGRPVAFLHVPDLPTEEGLSKGREVAVQLIRALVESFLEVGLKDVDLESEEKGSDHGIDGKSVAAKTDVNFVA